MSRDCKVALWLFVVSTVILRLRRVSGCGIHRRIPTLSIKQKAGFRDGSIWADRRRIKTTGRKSTLTLKSGKTLSGQFLRANPLRFRTLRGQTEEVPSTEIVSRSKKYYVSFPPFPALAMLPLVAVFITAQTM